MKVYEVTVTGEAREVYVVEAETEDEAKQIVENDPPQPELSEVEGASVTKVEEQKLPC